MVRLLQQSLFAVLFCTGGARARGRGYRCRSYGSEEKSCVVGEALPSSLQRTFRGKHGQPFLSQRHRLRLTLGCWWTPFCCELYTALSASIIDGLVSQRHRSLF